MTRCLSSLVLVLGLAVAAHAGQELDDQQLDQVPEPGGPAVRSGLEDLYAHQGVDQDDWQSEAISARIDERLHRWAEALGADPLGLSVPASDCVRCTLTPLLPPTAIAYESDLLVVHRANGENLPDERRLSGPEALSTELRRLLEALGKDSRRLAFKIVRVEPLDDREGAAARVRVLFSGFGDSPTGARELHSTWRMTWSLTDARPTLETLEVATFEQTTRLGGPLLADCTASVLQRNPSWSQQLQYPLHHWWRYLDRMSGVTFRGYQGLAVGDLDGDGLDDLFVAQPGGLPDRLYLQDPDGTARDVSAEAAIDYLELTRSALIADLDNDGDQDLAIVRSAHIVVMANDGRARFEPAAVLPLESAVMVSAADYDNDGDLDLYGVGYRNPDEGLPPTPYYDAENGQRNVLYRNDGDLEFTDATAAAGLDAGNRRFSFAGVWEDYDNDGDPDLYVANDFGRNNLFRNDGGRFQDVAAAAGVEDISAGMGVSWADFDLDGYMDLYVSNMFSSAGGRVTYQRRFRADDEAPTRDLFRRHARGNSLFRNLGDGTFQDVSEEAGVTMGRWAWGATFVDLDNNGYPDIVVPNGYLTNELEHDL